jgi:hypothetical protein
VTEIATSFKLITCIMPAGRGREVMNRLREEHRIVDVAINHARGVGTRRSRRRIVSAEKDVATLLVPVADADKVFAFLYREAGLGEPHAGMIFVSATVRGAPMAHPAGFIEF